MGGLFSRGEKQNPWIARGEAAFDKEQYDEACAHYIRAADLDPQNAGIAMRLALLQKYTGKYADAQRTYAKAAAADPQNKEAWIQSALLLGTEGNYADALLALEQGEIKTADLFVLEQKCEWLSRLKRYKDAADMAKELSQQKPDDEQYKAAYAEYLMRSGKCADAIGVYNELIQNFPENAGKYANDAALCAETLGDVETAISYYSHMNCVDSLSWYRRARLEEASGKFADAAASYGKVQEKEGKDEIHLALRRIYALFWSGNDKQAAAELEKLLPRSKEAPEVWYLLGTLCFMTGSLPRAAECFREVIQRAPSSVPSIWSMKGAAEFFSGQYKTAYASFRRAELIRSGKATTGTDLFEGEEMELMQSKQSSVTISFTEDNPELSAIEACCLAALGKIEEADKAALLALSLDNSRMDMQILHLRLLSALGKYQAADDIYSHIEELLPNDYAIRFEHAENDMLLGKFSKAAESLQKLLADYPENTMLYTKLFECLSAAGNYAEIKKISSEHMSSLPDTASVFQTTADAAYAAGDYAAAVEYYTKAAELQPENPVLSAGIGKSEMMLGHYAVAKDRFADAAAYLEENLGMVLLQAKCADAAGNLTEAANLYSAILQVCPNSGGVSADLTLIATILGNDELTETTVANAAAQNQATHLYYKLAGDACLHLSRYDDAINYYQKALDLRVDDLSVCTSMGFAYTTKGAYSEALSAFNKVLAANPESTGLLAGKAVCEINLGNLADAEDTLRALTEADPANLSALLQFADVLERQQKYDEMLEVYGMYLEKQPDNIDAFRKVSAVYAMRGNMEDALSGYELILSSCPEDSVTLRLKAQALATLGRFAEAADVCAEILSKGEPDASIRLIYAKALVNTGRYDEAMAEYIRILKADRTNSGVLFEYGDMLSRSGNYKKALIAFDRVLQTNPQHLLAHAERVSAAVKLGDPKTAIAALKSAAAVAEGNPYLLAGLGYMSALSGKQAEALIFYDKAEAAGCTDVDINCSRALIYLGQNKYDLALTAASAAVEACPQNSLFWRLKGKALEGLGKFEEAVSCYKSSLNPTESDDADFDITAGAGTDTGGMPGAVPGGEPKKDVKKEAKLLNNYEQPSATVAEENYEAELYGGSDEESSEIKETRKEKSNSLSQREVRDEVSNRRKAFGDSDPFGDDDVGRGKKPRGLIIN